MNGFQLTQEVRSNPDLADLPIIAVTSLAHEEDRQKGISAGVDAYLVKLHKETLLKEIFRLLNKADHKPEQEASIIA